MEKLILLLGALISKSQLEPIQSVFSDDLEVVSFNFSGHGGAPLSGDFSIVQFANEHHQFYETNAITSASIFGYSMWDIWQYIVHKCFPNTKPPLKT